jgi:hypothetical protein
MIHPFSEDWRKDWDDFINMSSSASFYHQTKWFPVMSAVSTFRENLSLVDEEGGKVMGVFPLCLVQQSRMKVVMPVPLSPRNCPLPESKAFREVVDDSAKASGAGASVFRSFTEGNKANGYDMSLNVQDAKPLRRTERKVRFAEKSGVEVKTGVPDFPYIGASRVQAAVADDRIASRKAMFQKVSKLEFGKDYVSMKAVFGSETAAGVIAYLFRDQAYIDFTGSRQEYHHLNPNVLLYSILIAWLRERGFQKLSMGQTSKDKETGNYRFTSQFGAVAEPFYEGWRSYTLKGKIMESLAR